MLKQESIDLTPIRSSHAQRIASVPEDKFEAVIRQLKQDEQQITRRAIKDLAKRLADLGASQRTTARMLGVGLGTVQRDLISLARLALVDKHDLTT